MKETEEIRRKRETLRKEILQMLEISMIKTGVTPDVNALISIMLMIIFAILTVSTIISLRSMKKVR